MKKTFLFMIFAILLGSITGKILFSEYKDLETVFNEEKIVYFIEEGVYLTKESLDNNTKNITPKLVINKDNKYHVYVAITKNYNNVSKLKKLYKDKGYSVIEKRITVNNVEFITNLDQFDILLDSATDKEIENIEKIILSNYEDLVL